MAQENEADIARSLSKNVYKHQYVETTGEKLVAMFRKIMDAQNQSLEQGAFALEHAQEEAKKISGSKYSGFFANSDTVQLYIRFMHLPEEYRTMDAVSLRWGLEHYLSPCCPMDHWVPLLPA
jgi:hypothetical protein